MGSTGLQSGLLLSARGFIAVMRWFFFVVGFFPFSSCTAVASAMSAARASEPHQTGISKPLSWLFRKGDARTKGGYWQLVHFVAPLRFPNDACALIEITAN